MRTEPSAITVDDAYSDGLDTCCDWNQVLSVGEQQRIAFARLLCHRYGILHWLVFMAHVWVFEWSLTVGFILSNSMSTGTSFCLFLCSLLSFVLLIDAFARVFRPAFAILDECTSGLDADSEALCYSLCARAGITCLSVGHRPSLARFHDRVLDMSSDGRWEIRSLHDTPVAPTSGTVGDCTPGSTDDSRPSRRLSAAEPNGSRKYKFDGLFMTRFWTLFRLAFHSVVR